MRLSEIGPFIQLKGGRGSSQHRLSGCHDVFDLRQRARRRIPRPIFDYVEGGAEEELSMKANLAAYRSRRFLPRTFVDVSTADSSARLLGRTLPVPLVLAPAGFTRMVHPDGELGAARSAHRHGLPYTLSSVATTSIEDVAATGHPDLWFQLYILKDAGLTAELVARAAAAGYRVLVVTVDTAVSGHRIRDRRNGLVIPPSLTLRSMGRLAARPAYCARMLSAPVVGFANFTGCSSTTIEQSIGMFSPAITWDDLAALRSRWAGHLVVKGPLGPADAARAAEAGADGIQLSNHGGRQLDRTVPPVELIARVRAAVGPSTTLLADSGIRHGADIAVALALGADAAAIGRAYLYGLMAGGEAGVHHALDLLTAQLTRTLQLLGVTSVDDLRKHGHEILAS